jgi:hypothetical protein
MEWFPATVGVAFILLTTLYLARYHRHPPDKFVPMAAWLRAGMYFCFCYLLAWYSGALPAALSGPVATPEQLADPFWQACVFGLFVLVTIGYWVIWARFTIRFDRKVELLPQIFFGLVWGLAAGFLFLSFWHLVKMAMPGLPTWGVFLVTYVIISMWQWLWQDYGWDVYISPEHDCPWSIAVKVPATHIPNVTFCLIFFAIYENYWIFVGMQTWALLGASIAMRMPSPWCKDETPAARRVTGLLGAGRARAAGYDAPGGRDDIYIRSTGLPAGTAIWVLFAHLFAALCPLLMLALAQKNMDYLETVIHAPDLLYVAALMMMVGGAFEIAQNSFEHHWYIEDEKPGYFDTVFGTMACLAMATMIAACFGQYVWLVALSYFLALSYPVLYRHNISKGVERAALGIGLVVAMYYCLGDPVVFLSFNTVFLTLYFYQLLHKTQAQAFHGFVAATSAFGMLTIPLAIYNSAHGEIVEAWKVFALTGVLWAVMLGTWPKMGRMSPTPNAHA